MWHGSAAGRVAKGAFSLLGIIAVAASGRGSYMDMAKARDDWKRCPYCGVPGNYNAEYVEDEKPQPQQIELSREQRETEKTLKTFYNVCGIIVIVFIIFAIILAAAV